MTPPEPSPAFQRFPGQGLWHGDLLVFDALPSTNGWALEHIAELHHGDALRAVRQTAGRGRFERRWSAPEDRALALSVILHPDRLRPETVALAGQAAAAAILNTLREYRVPALLKWPNDVMTADRKIAGILAEQDTASGRTVLGMGLNVNLTASDLSFILPRESATSLLLASGRAHDIAEVASVLRHELSHLLDRIDREGAAALLDAWARHDFLDGRAIRLQAAGETVAGRYAGIDAQGRLRLRTAAGEERLYAAGDVSIEDRGDPA